MSDIQGINPLSRNHRMDIIGDIVWNVFDHIKARLEKTDTDLVSISFAPADVYIVWFCFTLGNYKALVSTSLPDGRYYEVTYNANKGEMYIDTYVKVDNVQIDTVTKES
jgi:hypothetical protein